MRSGKQLGRRPTLTEFYRSGASVTAMRRQFGTWYGLVREMGDLEPNAIEVLTQHPAFLREIEITQMVKSYKMILLEALLEIDGWRSPPTIASICERSWQVMQRRRPLLADVPTELQNISPQAGTAWIAYWQKNPINAWTGGNRDEKRAVLFQGSGRSIHTGIFCSRKNYPAFEVDGPGTAGLTDSPRMNRGE
ncbi:MAG: hypothetical protein M5R42_15220 [Rhodocyclaceae bacterium]|nr:hypothetical protein [Rhodocyclaceae bacterium]